MREESPPQVASEKRVRLTDAQSPQSEASWAEVRGQLTSDTSPGTKIDLIFPSEATTLCYLLFSPSAEFRLLSTTLQTSEQCYELVATEVAFDLPSD